MGGNGRQRAATAIPLPLLLTVFVVLVPATTRAQAVPRTDTPRAGTLRVTFEPVITTWDRVFTATGDEPVGEELFREMHPRFGCTRVAGVFVCRYNASPVLVRAEHGAIDEVDAPVHLSRRIGLVLHRGEEPVPAPRQPPAPEATVHRLPRAIPLGQVPPLGAGADLP